MKQEDYKKWQKIVAKSWEDEKFKKELIANPEKVLKENGLNIAAGKKFQVHENSETMTHLVLPLKQAVIEEVDLSKVSGGSDVCCCMMSSN
jgi:hypothetical protein